MVFSTVAETALVPGRAVDDRVLAFSHEMFAHADQHCELFSAMVGKQSGAVVQQQIRKLLVDLVRDDVRGLAAGRESRDDSIRGAGTVRRRRLLRPADVVAAWKQAVVGSGGRWVVSAARPWRAHRHSVMPPVRLNLLPGRSADNVGL
jgi:hypothetical protein